MHGLLESEQFPNLYVQIKKKSALYNPLCGCCCEYFPLQFVDLEFAKYLLSRKSNECPKCIRYLY